MSTPRKNKVAKANEEKAQRKIEMPKATIDDKSIAMGQIEQLNTHHDNGRVIDAATVTAEQNTMPQLQAKAEVQNKTGLAGNNAMRKGTLPQLDNIQAKAEVQNPTGLAGNEEKPKSWSELLEERRNALKQEKTDAIKMQKYHALSDVLKAIGQMGGAAVGGAIGGNALDSAPAVGEYKESRGYLDALERAKQANDRLRALDEQGFKLAYSKQERDEERAYAEKQKAEQRAHEAEQKAEERAYKAKMEEEDRKFQKEMADYRAKIEQAATEGNLRLKAQLEAQAAEKEYAHEAAMKKLSLEITRLQMGKSGSSSSASATGGIPVQTRFTGKKIPVIFKDKTMVDIPSDAYDVIKDSIMGQEIGDEFVDKDNVNRIIRDNPQLVNEYMKILGLIEPTASAQKIGQADIETPINLNSGTYPYYQYVDNVNPANKPSNYVEANPENGTFEISGYKRK